MGFNSALKGLKLLKTPGMGVYSVKIGAWKVILLLWSRSHTMKQNGVLNSSNTFVNLATYVTGYIVYDQVRKIKLPSVILGRKYLQNTGSGRKT